MEAVSVRLPLILLAVGCFEGAVLSQIPFIRGDVDGDGGITLSDAVHLIQSLTNRSALTCQDAADFNDNGVVNLGDFGYLIEHLLTGEPIPARPHPQPGPDPTEDSLVCGERVPPSVEEGGAYSMSAQPIGSSIRLRISLENSVPVVGGLLSFSLPDGWSLDSKVLEVNPSLELSSFLGEDYILTGKVRADRKLVILWLLDTPAKQPGVSQNGMRPLFDVILCSGDTSLGNYTLAPAGDGELVDEAGLRRFAHSEGATVTIPVAGTVCPEPLPSRLTVRPYAWMADAEARVGEVFRVPFYSMANRKYKSLSLRAGWDVEVLRVLAIEKARPRTTLHGTFSNNDGFDPERKFTRRSIEGPYYSISYCDPCNLPGDNKFVAHAGVRNYLWPQIPDLPPDEDLYSANQEFHQFDLVMQVLPSAQESVTWVSLIEDPNSNGAPNTIGDNNAENYIWFNLPDKAHIQPRPLYQGRVTILPGAPPTSFIRGDVNLDGELSLTDVVTLLSNLFLGSTFIIRCPDAADMNDDGSLDVSDAVSILGFLFLGTAEPKPPYPFPGTDATEDALPCGG